VASVGTDRTIVSIRLVLPRNRIERLAVPGDPRSGRPVEPVAVASDPFRARPAGRRRAHQLDPGRQRAFGRRGGGFSGSPGGSVSRGPFQARFPWQASVGTSVEEFDFIREGQNVTVNGQQHSGPVNVVRKSLLGEISFVDRGQCQNRAKQTGGPFQELLRYFAMERFLCRMSTSEHTSRFVLKGGLMLRVWNAAQSPATRDIDFLARADNGVESITQIFKAVCDQDVIPDGVIFHGDTVHGIQSRKTRMTRVSESPLGQRFRSPAFRCKSIPVLATS